MANTYELTFVCNSPYDILTCGKFFLLVVVAALQSSRAGFYANLVKRGLGAVAALATDDSTNQAQLGDLGACAGACSISTCINLYQLATWLLIAPAAA